MLGLGFRAKGDFLAGKQQCHESSGLSRIAGEIASSRGLVPTATFWVTRSTLTTTSLHSSASVAGPTMWAATLSVQAATSCSASAVQPSVKEECTGGPWRTSRSELSRPSFGVY